MEKNGQDSGPDYPFLLLPCRCCASLEKVTSPLMKQVLISLLFYRWGDRSRHRHKEANNVMRSKNSWMNCGSGVDKLALEPFLLTVA